MPVATVTSGLSSAVGRRCSSVGRSFSSATSSRLIFSRSLRVSVEERDEERARTVRKDDKIVLRRQAVSMLSDQSQLVNALDDLGEATHRNERMHRELLYST